MTLTAEQVTYRHPGGGFALPPTDLSVRPGRLTALLGPSGSGKTTLARLLVGLLEPESGTVSADGRPVRSRRGRLSGHTALLDQDPVAAADPRLTLRLCITLPGALQGSRRGTGRGSGRVSARGSARGSGRGSHIDVDHLAREVCLDPSLLDQRPSDVSGGQLQRACLARALAQRPRYLVADEATAHLDPVNTALIAEVLRRRTDDGLGVLLITHDHRLADRWADEVVTLGA